MRFKRIPLAVAAGAVAALALASCAPGGPTTPSSSGTSSQTGSSSGAPSSGAPAEGGAKADLGAVTTADGNISVTVGAPDFVSYNGNTPQSYSTYNSAITGLMQAGFVYFGADGSIQPNKDLGSYEMVSEDPLTIKYTINPNAKWSDGTPITVADAILSWGSQNTEIVGSDKKPLFNNVSMDMADKVPAGPKGDINGKEFTVVFKQKDPDWALNTWLDFPAHVVAKQAGMSVEDLSKAILAKDGSKLAKATQFWNKGWTTAAGTLPDEALVPVSGPYKFKSWTAKQSLTLEANPDYYGVKPATKEITFRFVDDAAMVQSLQNKDVDVIAPQATVDTLAQLKALSNVNVLQGDTLTWEHLDFNFRDGSLFKDDLNLRKAFAMCVPRQQIVDNLIKPINPDAKVMNAREVFPFQSNYNDVVSASYQGQYDNVDIDGAKKLVEAAGKTGAKVRIGYVAGNQRRANEVQLIKASCDQAGFDIVDGADKNFFGPGGTQEKGNYDVALFAWAGSGQIASGQNIYSTGKPQNYGQFSNADVDAAWKTLAGSLDPKVHEEQVKVIEKLLWDNLYGIPVFAHPGLYAGSTDIDQLRYTSTQSGITWNAEQWARKAQ